MLSKKTNCRLSFLVFFVLLFSLLPFTAQAANEDYDTGTEHISESTIQYGTNAVLAEYQAVADDILNYYLGTRVMTDDELQSMVADMEPEICYEAYYEIVSLDVELEYAYNEGLLTDADIAQFLDANTLLVNFSDSIHEKAMQAAPDISSFATNLTPITGVTVTDDNGSGSLNDGVVTITVQGGYVTATTNTVTITNTSGNAATLSFNYSVSGQKSTTLPTTSGSYSNLLQAGGTYSFNVVAPKYKKTATLTLSNFSLVEAATTSDVTITYNSSIGSVKAASSTVASGTTLEDVSLSEGIALVASANSGATFLGWVDESTHELLSTATTYTYTPAGDSTVIAAFAKSDADAWFSVGTKYFNDLNDAGTTAASSGGVVILAADGTLTAGDYTIPSGVTLLIPYDSANTLCTTKPTTVTSGTTFISLAAESYTKPTVYRALNMASGANITVKGAMSLSGKSNARQTYNGCPYGPLSFVNMASGSNITVNSGAFLYAWGYITGSGSLTVKSGGTVYEDFQVKDWRGGTAASAMIDNDQRVFPVSQYYVQNVEVPMTFEAGALEYGYMSLVATKVFGETTVPFIGGSGMFQNSGTIVKDYNEGTDRLEVTIDGALTMSNLNLEISSYKMNSANYVLPITNNLKVTVNSGTTTIGQDMCMLPGSEITIAGEANIALASGVSFFVYDLTEWSGKLFVYSAKDVSPLSYVGAKKGAPVSRSLADAKIIVNGTLDASAGYLYTTTTGANITSDGNGEVKIATPGEATITYQATQGGTDGTDITFVDVKISPAQLINSDNTYTKTADASGGSYVYEEGYWHRALFDIVSSSIAVQDGLDMYFYVEKADLYTNEEYYAVVTKEFASDYYVDGELVTEVTEKIFFEDWDDYDSTRMRFCFSDISAKEMTDNITAVVYYADNDGNAANDIVASNVRIDSIEDYTLRTLKGTEDTDGKLRTALVDMLIYGAECQKHFDYNQSALATAQAGEYLQYATGTTPSSESDPSGTNFVASSVSAKNKLMYTFFFSGITDEQLESLTATVTYTDWTGKSHTLDPISGADFYKYPNADWYGVDVEGLSMVDGRQKVNCTVKNGSDVVAEGVDSVEGYVARAGGSEAESVYVEMLSFVDSAKAYFESLQPTTA